MSTIFHTQKVEAAKDVVFPSRVLKRQLEDAQQRLRVMEEELQMVKNQELRERKRRKKTTRVSTSFLVRLGWERQRVSPQNYKSVSVSFQGVLVFL